MEADPFLLQHCESRASSIEAATPVRHDRASRWIAAIDHVLAKLMHVVLWSVEFEFMPTTSRKPVNSSPRTPRSSTQDATCTRYRPEDLTTRRQLAPAQTKDHSRLLTFVSCSSYRESESAAHYAASSLDHAGLVLELVHELVDAGHLDAGLAGGGVLDLQHLDTRRQVHAQAVGRERLDLLLLGLHDVGQRGVARLVEAQVGRDHGGQPQRAGEHAAAHGGHAGLRARAGRAAGAQGQQQRRQQAAAAAGRDPRAAGRRLLLPGGGRGGRQAHQGAAAAAGPRALLPGAHGRDHGRGGGRRRPGEFGQVAGAAMELPDGAESAGRAGGRRSAHVERELAAAAGAAGVDMTAATSLFDSASFSELGLALDWCDLLLLLHCLQASKPILHHRTSSSRVATEASVFTDIEQLAWRILQNDIRVFTSASLPHNAGSRTATESIEKHVHDQVELLLNFCGKQIHAREWKALLLMDISFFWIEQNDTGDHSPSKFATALLLLQAIFETEEIVSALKNSMTVCRDIQAWSFGRLGQVFQSSCASIECPSISLRKSSWEELHRFLSQEVGKFIQSTTSSIVRYGHGGDGDSGDDEEEDAGLQRFRFNSLDAFYQQNASLDGAASIGLVFQKVLSCLIGFEKAASRSKVSSDGVSIAGLHENDGDIKQWLVDLVSNWKYFFHWVCQDSDELLNQPTQGRPRGKSAWWKLVARIYIGCAVCNVAIELLMQQQPTGASRDQDKADQLLVAFSGDESGISVWSLMEVEFSLHRMLQKLGAHYTNEMETSLSKEHVKAVSYGLHRVLQPEKRHILTAIKNALHETAQEKAAAVDRPSGMSFDAVLFTIDSCCSTFEDEDLYGSYFPRDSEADGLWEAGSILEMLLSIYLNVRDRTVTTSDLPSDNESDQAACISQFSVYADTILVKLPLSARLLVAPAKKCEGSSVAGLETSLESVHDRIGVVLQNVVWIDQYQQPEGASRCTFVRLSHYFLGDVKKFVQLDGFTKLGVACAALSKRLCAIGAEIVDLNTAPSYWDALSSLAYDILCDNVVYNPRLLRLLSSICLPTHLARRINTFVTMESKIEGIIQACGFDSRANVANPTDMNENHCKRRTPSKDKRDRKRTPVRRKRLRQDFDARSPYGLQVESDSDSSASYSSDSDVSVRSDDSSAITDTNCSIGRFNQTGLPNRNRIPHVQSQASQSIAILAILTVLEQSQSSLLSAITAKNSGSKPCMLPSHQEILRYICIHELVNQAICDSPDFSWGTRKVLLKVLHMIELGLRIGKASGALRRGDGLECGLQPDTTICIFEASVVSALKSRTWVAGIKDASQDSGTKSKVSATLLKMDIFFLQIPVTAQSWLKESSLSDVSKDHLKALVGLVRERIVPTDPANVRQGKAKARQRLLGVVPIVRKRRKRLRSRHPIIDAFLNEEDGADAFADLEDFIE
ncbi:hypothetical protein ON010_g287 [Phytophthora cinnamomi]|nr:hypothetical protein ON010_g287 [Phytophthora cinnamomi]